MFAPYLIGLLYVLEPHNLIVGGGFGPENTQASMERDVSVLFEVLTSSKTVLYADGLESTRSVQFLSEVDEYSSLLGLIFDDLANLSVSYRKPSIAINGAANTQTLQEYILKYAKHDDIILWWVGHGQRDVEDNSVKFDLWEEEVSALELRNILDKSHKKSSFTAILGHCYASAFNKIIYSKIPNKLSKQNRCIFAAAEANKPAAGCSVDKQSSHAYIWHFADAIKTKRGDINLDGKIELQEAHAYAVVNDPTIDEPIKSSQLYLIDKIQVSLPAYMTKSQLISMADFTEKYILENVYAVEPEQTIRAFRQKVAEQKQKIAHIETKLDVLYEQLWEIRDGFYSQLVSRWPELVNLMHPKSRALLGGQSTELKDYVYKHLDLLGVKSNDRQIRKATNLLWQYQRRLAKMNRWVRTAQTAFARRHMSRDQGLAYQSLRICESRSLSGGLRQ